MSIPLYTHTMPARLVTAAMVLQRAVTVLSFVLSVTKKLSPAKRRNPVAKSLGSTHLKPRIVRNKKKYRRKGRVDKSSRSQPDS